MTIVALDYMIRVTGDCAGLQPIFEFFRQTVFHYQRRASNASAVFGHSPSVLRAAHLSRDVVSRRADRLDDQNVNTAKTEAQQPSMSAVAEPSHCGCRRRRRRVLFSREQTVALEEWFGRHSYLSAAERDRLAASLALRPSQVKIWFQNRRYKLKKIRRQMERNHDRLMASSAAVSSTAAAAPHHFSISELSVHVGDVGDRRSVVQPSVVRRIAVPILVRDGRPCWSRTIRHSQC